MSMPFYVSPEQLMKDRADFARKGIARGRSVVAVQFADGVLFVSENPSQALHKVSEIYDRIAFAAVGRYNEFENLRIAGVRLADMRGYSYDRRDVTGRGLANAYAQTLGTIFSSGGEKPYEVEIFVAEIGDDAADDQIYRLTYDGQVADEQGYAVMGGAADVVAGYLEERYAEGASLEDAVRLAVAALGHTESRRPGHPRRGPRGRGPRPHPQPAAQVRPGDAERASASCSASAAAEPNPEPRPSTPCRPMGRRATSPSPVVELTRRAPTDADRPGRAAGVAAPRARRIPGPGTPALTPPGRRRGTWTRGRLDVRRRRVRRVAVPSSLGRRSRSPAPTSRARDRPSARARRARARTARA